MTFRQLALNNVFRSFRNYAAYFFSSTFCVMVFFIYAMFAFHPSLSAGRLRNAAVGMHFAEFIIYVFTFFFILYSMSTFIKSRKKEFGLLIMHGMTPMQLRKLVFIENLAIGALSIALGTGLGLLFSKGILVLSAKILNMKEALPFYIPVYALLLTSIAFLLLFLIISLFTSFFLRTGRLIELLKGSEKPRIEPKAGAIRAVLAAVLLAGGYAAALMARGEEVVLAMIPVSTLVIIGTYLLFTQLSVYLINKLRSNESIYLQRTNIVTLSDLAFRMKDNARMFFIVAIVSTVAFSAIGTLVGFRSLMLKGTSIQEKHAFTYLSDAGNSLSDQHQLLIEKELKKNQFPYSKLSAKYKISEETGSGDIYTVIKKSDYNAFAKNAGKKEISASNNRNYIVPAELLYAQGVRQTYEKPIFLKGSPQELAVSGVQKNIVYPGRLQAGDALIVPDRVYEGIPGKERSAVSYDIKQPERTGKIAQKLQSAIGTSEDNAYSFSSYALKMQETKQEINIFLFVGLFIGLVFFASAGSFLYFRLYADFEEDSLKYKAIAKLGLTGKELSKIVTKQIGLLFFVPVGVALVHGFIALIALSHMFSTELWSEIALVLSCFALFQLFYFLFIRSQYIRNLLKAL
ncbi:ABC transporter permease [Metabacillus sp. GX 13764]|uniref:FtsX-like permease family protein n=1 Tax=Metabacillus kandeliae TaxID=2900151 RepID=UPI001E4816A7|nr:ABC transporter permease [Metabacillus kandeliae]MCD7036032.1 ABC transporter permease [Metabacillus kandeliae]